MALYDKIRKMHFSSYKVLLSTEEHNCGVRVQNSFLVCRDGKKQFAYTHIHGGKTGQIDIIHTLVS